MTGGEVWLQTHPRVWWLCIWAISGRVNGEDWVSLQDVPNLHIVLLRLMGGAFAVYQQLKQEEKRFQPDKICTVYSFYHERVPSLWAIHLATFTPWGISWPLFGGVKTLCSAWWKSDHGVAYAFMQGLNISFALWSWWTTYPLTSCWPVRE